MHPKWHLRWSVSLLLFATFSYASRLHAAVDFIAYKTQLEQAELHEQQGDWDKACLVYESILRLDRNAPEVLKRYQICWRRYWQVRRHADLSFRGEVLSLDYAQSLRLYTMICDTLRENALDKKKAEPANLFRKGLEELDNALTDPFFLQQYLPSVKPRDIRAFRDFLKKNWAVDEKLNGPQVMKQLREVALAAQAALPLNCNIVLMEFACGACYALDEYTLYLTPSQLRELCDSLRGESAGVGQPSIAFAMKNERVGYVHIACFQETTLQEMEDALAALSKDGMKALILDLRGNSGGIFEMAIDVARRFIPSGVIASTQNSDPKFSTVYHARNPNAFLMPLVVMIDGDTASAAEVLAGALKDNKRARLVGQTTFGKGCTQCVLKLPAAPGGVPTGGMRLTVARFFSPEGLPYSGRGVVPHVPLESMPSMHEFDHFTAAAMVEALRLLDAQ